MLSLRENARCAEAIEHAIQNHYKDNSLRMDGIQAVIEDFGFERVNWVLAYNARRLSHDRRISRGNKAWAQEVSILEDDGADAKWQRSFRILSHPGLINLCINHVREQQEALLAEKQSQAPPDEQKRGEINMDYGEATSKSLAHISTGNFPPHFTKSLGNTTPCIPCVFCYVWRKISALLCAPNSLVASLDFFAGIGLFRLGLEQAGFRCRGHCEIDRFANLSYNAMHQPKGDEWFGKDITKVRAESLPDVALWVGGFPCQDCSVGAGGNRKGLRGERCARIRKHKFRNAESYGYCVNLP